MLTAAAHSKLKRRIVLHEDEVTSCIFGEMQYLPTNIICQIFNQLTKDAKLKDVKTIESVFCNFPDEVNFDFWPQWKTGVRHVEPDLIVHFSKENSPLLHVIVEVKWGGRLFPPCELIRQWNWRYSKRKDDAPWIHLYLVKDTAMGRTEIENSLFASNELCKGCTHCKDRKRLYKGSKIDPLEEWHGRLGCIGWRHVIKDISEINYAWGCGVSAFFAKQGIVPFTGFEFLSKEDMCELTTDQILSFHSDSWFDFLSNIKISKD